MGDFPKQFHHRKTERGLEVWDVDRVIALARGLPRHSVPVNEIHEFDQVYWFDGARHPPTCRAVVEHARRIEAADLGEPIILSSTGVVMDGMHRVAKAVLLGRDAVEAVRFECDPEPDRVEPVADGGAAPHPDSGS